MPIECFYINDTLSLGKQVFLREKELHHLSHVVRVQVGEEVSLVNGKGTKAKASLLQVSSREAKMEVLSVEEQSPSPHTLILAQGMPRIPRLEYIVEKSTELGVTEIWLFPGERGEKTTLSPSGQERLQHILVASMKQCGRLFLPQIRILPSLLQWKKEEILYQAFFGDVRSSASSLLQALSQNSFSSLLCVIGSESGFSQVEISHMESNLGIQGVHLHENILRTDTAAITMLALASSFLLYQFPTSPH